MEKQLEALSLLAQIDRWRDELRAAEEEVAALAAKADRGAATDEELRRIGEKERLAGERKIPLTKAVARLRALSPEIFADWVAVNRQALERTILKALAGTRPGLRSVEEGLARIAKEAKYTAEDLHALQLSGFLDEWKSLLAGRHPYALQPPSWEAWPVAAPTTLTLRSPLPVPASIAARHADILAQNDWKAWHAGLVFFAEALTILDQGKTAPLTRETGARSAAGAWQSSWEISTGSLALSSSWGERETETPGKLDSFSAVEIRGLLPGEGLTWDGALGSETSGLVTTWTGLREDRRRAIETVARLLFAEVGFNPFHAG